MNAQRGTALQAALWGRGGADDVEEWDAESSREVEVENNGQEGSRSGIKQLVIRALVKCYPWVHAATEGVKLAHF